MRHGTDNLGTFTLGVPGLHNVQNSMAALAVSTHVGMDIEDCRGALAQFKGAERRFQVRGEPGGVIIVDDYAHHPTEIKATLAAARRRYPGTRFGPSFNPIRTVARMYCKKNLRGILWTQSTCWSPIFLLHESTNNPA